MVVRSISLFIDIPGAFYDSAKNYVGLGPSN